MLPGCQPHLGSRLTGGDTCYDECPSTLLVAVIRSDTGGLIRIIAGIFFGKVMAKSKNSYVLSRA
jgi:hypothetical protein